MVISIEVEKNVGKIDVIADFSKKVEKAGRFKVFLYFIYAGLLVMLLLAFGLSFCMSGAAVAESTPYRREEAWFLKNRVEPGETCAETLLDEGFFLADEENARYFWDRRGRESGGWFILDADMPVESGIHITAVVLGREGKNCGYVDIFNDSARKRALKNCRIYRIEIAER